MTITKTLMLAGVAALSLGAGAVRAQTMIPSAAQGSYYAVQSRAAANKAVAHETRGTVSSAVQSGASDPGLSGPVVHIDTNLTGGGL